MQADVSEKNRPKRLVRSSCTEPLQITRPVHLIGHILNWRGQRLLNFRRCGLFFATMLRLFDFDFDTIPESKNLIDDVLRQNIMATNMKKTGNILDFVVELAKEGNSEKEMLAGVKREYGEPSAHTTYIVGREWRGVNGRPSKAAKTAKGVPVNDATPGNELQIEPEQENGEELNLPVNQREVLTGPGEPEVRSPHHKQKRGRLILQPDFQRQYVWDRKKASRLVESVLLRVPLPIIYLSEQQDRKNT